MKKKVIIIGAGPAGLFTAIKAKNINNDALVLEKKFSGREKAFNLWNRTVQSHPYR
jgi:thioredoxin reductase